jgi:hypothetical protein
MTDEERRQGPKTTKRGFFYHETPILDRRWTQMNADGTPPRVSRPTHLRGLNACPFSHPSLRVRMQESGGFSHCLFSECPLPEFVCPTVGREGAAIQAARRGGQPHPAPSGRDICSPQSLIDDPTQECSPEYAAPPGLFGLVGCGATKMSRLRRLAGTTQLKIGSTADDR